MGLNKESIQAIKDRADIVQIVGERVHLAPAGAQFKGLCPFHSEKTPSFTVNPQRRMFHCFGCGAGGSVIDFVMTYERLEFAEAATQLAERLGIALGRSVAPGQARALDALELARQFYRDNLLKRPEGEVARRYLRERHFGEELWEAFSLGFALDDEANQENLPRISGKDTKPVLIVTADEEAMIDGLCRMTSNAP